MRDIPAFITSDENPALAGLAAYARTLSRFGVELDGRWWRAGA